MTTINGKSLGFGYWGGAAHSHTPEGDVIVRNITSDAGVCWPKAADKFQVTTTFDSFTSPVFSKVEEAFGWAVAMYGKDA